jgi:hypothetical protein
MHGGKDIGGESTHGRLSLVGRPAGFEVETDHARAQFLADVAQLFQNGCGAAAQERAQFELLLQRQRGLRTHGLEAAQQLRIARSEETGLRHQAIGLDHSWHEMVALNAGSRRRKSLLVGVGQIHREMTVYHLVRFRLPTMLCRLLEVVLRGRFGSSEVCERETESDAPPRGKLG